MPMRNLKLISFIISGPRWASWNLGVFLCIRCAGIHRNLGVHISKVKSVNLDSWTPEQVVSLQQMGNSRARAVYEANLPDNFRRPQSDSSLESFIRAKYEHKKYIAREWVPPVIPKVDWEKEIDEEIERQKRKKKTTTTIDKKPIKIAEVPQIPKPKSSASPKPARSQVPTEKTTQDLLGLQNGEDGFSGFLSAKEEGKKDEKIDAAKAEEESFFNQPAPSEKEKTKLTKDSILALYGNTPQQPIFNPGFQQPVGVSQQSFPQNYQFQQGFNQFPQQTYPVQNGIPQYQPGTQFQQFPQTQFATPMAFPTSPAQGQFVSQPPQFNQFQPMPQAQVPQFGIQSQFNQQTNFQAFGVQNNANPFCTNPPLQQQFASMSISNQVPANKTVPTVASNLWQ